MAKKKSSVIEKRFDADVAQHKSALVETDIHELGDKRLNPEEAVAREREALLAQCEAKQISHQRELADPARSEGPRIHWSQFLYRLQKIQPRLQAKSSNVYGVPTIALYWEKTTLEKLNDGSYFEMAGTDKEKFHRDHRYVSGFDKTDLPFYSHVLLDSSKLPVREVRGVASVLTALIKQKIVTLEQVKKEFFNPAEDKRGGIMLEQIVN